MKPFKLTTSLLAALILTAFDGGSHLRITYQKSSILQLIVSSL